MTCKCGKPTRDDAYVCEDDLTELAKALGDVPWLDEQLEITISSQKAATYDGSPSRGAETPSPVHWGASEARTHLRALLVSWTLFCEAERVTSRAGIVGLPDDNLPAMSRWLLNRVDGLGFHEIGPDAVEEITSAVAHCHRLVDRRPDRWYAGPCNAETDGVECGADLYAKSQVGFVTCPSCEWQHDVTARRAWLLAEAEDRLADASTVARAVSWLGAEPLTPARVRKWAQRGRIVVKGHDGKAPLYRIGDAIDLLASDTNKAG